MNSWKVNLGERELKEIEFARVYASKFGHGTDGHNRLILLAKLADLLDELERTQESATA